MSLLEQAIEHNRQEARELEAVTSWAIKHKIGDTFDDLAEQININKYYVSIWIKPDLEVYKQIRKRMGKGWKKLPNHSFTDNDGDVYSTFTKGGRELIIVGRARYADGTKCKRIKTGEKTVNVYRVVCE